MAEVDRVLPRPPRGERGNRLSVAAKRRVRELGLAPTRDQFLNENQIWRNQLPGLTVSCKKLFVIRHGPSLVRREPINRGVCSRFQNGGKDTADFHQIGFGGGIDR